MAERSSFLLGPAGTGKSTALQHRLLQLLADGEPAYTILVIVAEPEHRHQFLDTLHDSGQGPYADLKISSFSDLTKEMVSLFWPLVARPAGFQHPYQPPTFLSYDLAQLLMWRIITPMLSQGAFADLRLRPQQIVSQLLDTLNRAALNSLSLEQAARRQISTWAGEPDQLRHLNDSAKAAHAFRRICLENSLLDLSLMVETFDTQLVQHPEFSRYFSERFRHLIVDNVEEQTPAGQNFIHSLIPAVQSCAIAFDAGGGYKRFLAADPLGASSFRSLCHTVIEFDHRFLAPPEMTQLANMVENFLSATKKSTVGAEHGILDIVDGRYRREMIQKLVRTLRNLIAEQGIPPGEVAIITPYLDGVLRYSLTQSLKDAGIPYRLLRRRTSPREEPLVRTWLTWLALAHPDWDTHPTPYDIAEALTLSIAGLDPARAQLLTDHLYQPQGPVLLSVDHLPEQVAGRVDQEITALVEELRVWLSAHENSHTLDGFLLALFTQLLSDRRFQPEPDLAGAAVCDWLAQSALRLRQAAPAMGLGTPAEIGRTFIEGINQGLVTANPPDLGDPPDPEGLLISTVYGYLLAGHPVQVQVWLDTASIGWWDIPNQPLSNTFVLAQSRDEERIWTMEEDFAIRNQLLSRIIRGLTNRCATGVVLASSALDRRGQRQDGVLWRALQPARVLR